MILRVATYGCVLLMLFMACTPEEDARQGDNTIDSADTDEANNKISDTHTGSPGTSSQPGEDGESSSGCTSMDILFIIDDSASMSEEQENLKANFPKFIEVLDSYQIGDGESLDYRIGVTTIGVVRSYKSGGMTRTTEDMNTTVDDGVLLGSGTGGEPFCGLAEPWLAGPGSGVTDTFNCMATLGTGGTFTEMPFAVIEQALGSKSDPGGVNAGFYRKGTDSLLVLVIITDEDDCSVEEGGTLVVSAVGASDCDETKSKGLYAVRDTKTFLDDVTGGEGRYVVVNIAGLGQCVTDFGKADAAPRLQALSEMLSPHSIFGDICQGDLWKSLQAGLDVMQGSCREMPVVI